LALAGTTFSACGQDEEEGVGRVYNLTSNCKSEVVTKAPIPDKFSFYYTSFRYSENSMKGDVDFMNQYGAWMPYKFYCDGNNLGEVSYTSVREGYWKD